MNAVLDQSLERLAAALSEERRAILEHDVEALIRSTQEKLESLRSLENLVPPAAPAASADFESRLSALAEANHANGALLARRRREVNWALRHLGRSESAGAYDAHGQTNTVKATRALAVV
jgi:flagellar biosynthesis/type III secretory pathway chaperone